MLKKYVCKDKNGKKVFEGDTFHILGSSNYDKLDECKFFWDQGTLSFGIKIRRMNPKWASFGGTSLIGQPWVYVGDMIEKKAATK